MFTAAGFEWREPGCSMCLAMNPDKLAVGERCASTSNRNFEGRQGRGGRTHLVSPAVAAATAVAGHFATPEDLDLMEPVVVVTGRAVPLDRTDVDTDQIIPSDWLKRVERTGLRRRPVLGVARRPRLRAQPPRVRRGHHPGRRAQLRHRLVARARRVGADGLRIRGRRLVALRRHLPQQLHQAGAAAGAGRRGARPAAARRRGEPTRRSRSRSTSPGARSRRRRPAWPAPSRSTSSPASGCSTGGTTSACRCATRTTSPPTSGAAPPSCRRPRPRHGHVPADDRGRRPGRRRRVRQRLPRHAGAPLAAR